MYPLVEILMSLHITYPSMPQWYVPAVFPNVRLAGLAPANYCGAYPNLIIIYEMK